MNSHCDSVIRSLEDHPSRLNKEAIIEAEKRPNMRFIVDEVTGTLITIIHADKNKQRVH